MSAGVEAGDGTATVIGSLKSWAGQPFNSQGNLGSWFLFTGLVIVMAILWMFILRETLGEL